MDLARLGKKAIFIPTPGQTEQTYLAAFLQRKDCLCNASKRYEFGASASTSFDGFQVSEENTDWNSLFKLF